MHVYIELVAASDDADRDRAGNAMSHPGFQHDSVPADRAINVVGEIKVSDLLADDLSLKPQSGSGDSVAACEFLAGGVQASGLETHQAQREEDKYQDTGNQQIRQFSTLSSCSSSHRESIPVSSSTSSCPEAVTDGPYAALNALLARTVSTVAADSTAPERACDVITRGLLGWNSTAPGGASFDSSYKRTRNVPSARARAADTLCRPKPFGLRG